MADQETRVTGNDALSGVDPGGTRSTKPGNPDKSDVSKAGPNTGEKPAVSGKTVGTANPDRSSQ